MRSIFTGTIISAVVSVALTQVAAAQDAGGYYVKAFGGLSGLEANDFALGGTTQPLSFGNGASFGGAVGYAYAGSPWRAELEFAYRTGDTDSFPAGVGTGGDFASTALMVNGYYVFETGSSIKPYVGLGLGALTEVDFDISAAGGETEYSDRGGFAYQAMVGVEFPVSDRFALYGEARYFSAGSVDLAGPGGATLSADYDTFDVNFGAVFKF